MWLAVPLPDEPNVSLPGFFLAYSTSSLHRLDADRGMNDEAADDVADAADRIEALDRIVGGLAQGRHHRQRRVGRQEKVVAVGRRLRCRLGADHAAGAAAVLDHELLAEGLAEFVGPGTPDRVGGAARRIGQDDLDRALGPALGLRHGIGRERCGKRGTSQRQKCATTHEVLPGYCRFFPGWTAAPPPSIQRLQIARGRSAHRRSGQSHSAAFAGGRMRGITSPANSSSDALAFSVPYQGG